MKILLINPNTSEFVTHRAVAAAAAAARPSTEIQGVTGQFGAPIINSEADIIIGAYSALDLAAKHSADFDGIALAVSFDTGLAGLREVVSAPVSGMAEASLRAAAATGESIGIISFASRTAPLYLRLARTYVAERKLAGVHCIDGLTEAQLKAPELLKRRLKAEIQLAVRQLRCDTVVLLATAFAGLSDDVAADVKVIDAVAAMLSELENAAVDPQLHRLLTCTRWPERKTMTGISAELEQKYRTFPQD